MVLNLRKTVRAAFPAVSHWCRLPGLVSWAAVVIGTILAFQVPFRSCAGFGHHAVLVHWLLLLCMVALCAAGIFLRPFIIRFAAFLLFAILLCMLHRAHQVDVFSFLRKNIRGAEGVSFIGKTASAPLPCFENFHFLLKIDSAIGIPSKLIRGKTVNCICPFEPPQYGKIAVHGVLSPPQPRRNPYEYDQYTAMMADGVWGTFTADSCRIIAGRRTPLERLSVWFRNSTVAALRKITDFDNRALLQASFLGNTEFLSPYIRDIFRQSGIYHLIAISGLNTAMLVSALYFFLQLLPLSRMTGRMVCIAALWAYLPFVGMIPSLFRATVMTSCVLAAMLFEKKNYALHTLGLAGTIWFVLSPESLFNPGYQLSFAATFGLLTLFPVFSRFTPRPGSRFLRTIVFFLFSSFYVSLTSFLATAPILLYHFGTVSYFGLIANLVAVAAMTISMWAFCAGLLLQILVPFLAALPLWISERFLDVVVGTGKLATHFSWSRATYPAPFPEMVLLFALFLIGLTAVNRDRIKAYLLLSVIIAAVCVPADMLLRRSSHHLEVVRFAVPGYPIIGIKWPEKRAGVWLITVNPNRSLPRLLGQHIIPWVRHADGNRLDAIFVPELSVAETAEAVTMSGKKVPALAFTRILTFPAVGRNADSISTRCTPCDGCTCSISAPACASAVSVRITAPGFAAATLLLDAQNPLRRKKMTVSAAGETLSALVMTRDKTYAVVPQDHPVR
jgi:ComEC/Rec2-related protein